MRKTHFIAGQIDGYTTTNCGLNAAKDGVIHVPPRSATCINCKKGIRRKKIEK